MKMSEPIRSQIVEALNNVVERVAVPLGYVCVFDGIEEGEKNNPFWGDMLSSLSGSFHNRIWVLPEWEDERKEYKHYDGTMKLERLKQMDVDFHFTSPRINLNFPSGSIHISIKEDLTMSEAQIFGEDAADIFPVIRNMIKDELRTFKK